MKTWLLRRFLSDEEGSAARNFILSSVVWLVVSSTVGIVVAIKMSSPQFLGGIPWLTFGRIRPIHTNGQLFGWLSMVQIGLALYVLTKLTRVNLYSERLANLVMWVWNLVVLVAAITLALGMNQGREYAELIWPLDILVLVGLGLLAFNVFMTVLRRRERQIYVSLWYIMGSFIWMPLIYFIGNIVWVTPWNSGPGAPFGGALAGVNDANINWFYGHNVLGLWFTTLGVASIYYLLPVVSRNPLYSHRLSLIGFWTIGTFYIWTGAHHLVWGPVPYWLQTIAIIFSVLLIIPVSTVVVNFLGTVRGHWDLLIKSPPIRFFITGTIFYLITCLQGPTQALRSVSQVVKFTNWVPGHAHLALFGTFSFMAFGGVYYVLPRLLGRKSMAHPALIEWQYWIALIGFFGFATSLWVGGLVQGAMWISGVPFLEGVRAQSPYYLVRAISGELMLVSVLIFAYNVYVTAVRRGEETSPVPGAAPVAA
jgi:cbb3-type cytochrome c oxidase subunit I